MKKSFYIKIGLFVFVVILITGCSLEYRELFKETDKFVESLTTTYESYGISEKHNVTTSDELYKIMPMGRLIIVKIDKAVDDKEYEKLRNALERHYRNDKRVNKVYINQGGTVVIDCRN
jgi:hypothetical protein